MEGGDLDGFALAASWGKKAHLLCRPVDLLKKQKLNRHRPKQQLGGAHLEQAAFGVNSHLQSHDDEYDQPSSRTSSLGGLVVSPAVGCLVGCILPVAPRCLFLVILLGTCLNARFVMC
jgi:hypothetical protein